MSNGRDTVGTDGAGLPERVVVTIERTAGRIDDLDSVGAIGL